MSELSAYPTKLPPALETIGAKCFHPSGTFVEFKKEEVERSIPERFEKIVQMYPDRLAVKMGDQSVTYSELNAMANRLACVILDQRGSEAEPVGLLFEKGVSQIAAMLGVLKAGKFFVLLDPSFPKARHEVLLEDSQARLMITERQKPWLTQGVAINGCQLIELDSINVINSAENPRITISPSTIAFILYTSGSTGAPKGVVWTHRNLLHHEMLHSKASHITQDDRITLLPSGTANMVTNTFLALLSGSMVLPFNVQKEGVLQLSGWLREERISVCLISSALFRSLCEGLTEEVEFPDLRLIRLRSEGVRKSDVDLFKKIFPLQCSLVNGLSSTETGVLTVFPIGRTTDLTGNEIPVGYAVEDKEILLLDEAGNKVGFNQVGEIAVRSRYLSPGYWRKPELTEAKFKADPEAGDRRLYLTGDLGLMLPGGCLIHKGRKDFRVKVRGYGVELAEVEKVLCDHADIRDIVVVARQNETGEARLIAYFTSNSSSGPSTSGLRIFLQQKLPDYMIPSSFVRLETLPLTVSGKVDRQFLPAPDSSRPELDTPYVEPGTPLEKELAKIWCEVLGVEQIGIHDNFFDLGGHSLRAMQLISRIRDGFQVEIPLHYIFEAPTLAALSRYMETASQPSHGAETLSPQPVLRDGELPLSFAQQRLWFLDQLEPGSSAYNFSAIFRLKGRLNETAFEQSFNEIIKRHEALRTVFHAFNGSPFQIILPFMTIKLRRIDLRDIVSDTQRDSEARHLSTAEVEQPLDLAHGPLLRVTLMRLTEDEFRLLLTMHHIVSDGWSMGVLFRELNALYDAFSKGHPSPLVELPVQYADFAQWQRQQLRGERLEKQLAYWKKQLENVPTQQLPTDRQRSTLRTDNGARRHFVLSDNLSAALKSLSNRYGVTLFMVLLAAYQTLLQRSTGQNDIVVGAPVAGRNNREIEGLIGFFLNMLVLRTDLTGDPTFPELLARVRKICLEAYSHQDLPFEKLVEELNPERNLSHHPLFQVTFALRNTPRCPLALNGVSAKELEGYGGVRFDLHLFMEEEEGHLQGWVDYSKDLFNGETIDRMIGHFQTLLEGVVSNPDRCISDLPILTEAERHQLLVEWNDTKIDYPKDKCIHELFEEEVNKSPDSVALVFENQQLTYRELNCRANQLARYLRNQGVGPETLVAICLERSIEMVVGLLGVLKAGGAYLALDPAYPKERMEFMLDDSQTSVLLTQERFMEGLAQERRLQSTAGACQNSKRDPRLKVICLDRDWGDISEGSGENLQSQATAENLAYVIYTSGSTGKPKGVTIEHRNAVAFLTWAHSVFTKEDFAGVIASTSICFDLSIFELFAPLTSGGRVILIENALGLNQMDGALRPTLINTVPSVMAELFRLGELPASIRTVNLAGEPLKTSLVQEIYKQTSAQRVYDLYGPSETTTYSTYRWRTVDGVQTIGRPIANTEIYILDSHLNLVPIGVRGELYIGGADLARGYLNRPDLTTEKFIPNPFSTESGARLYRTGDLARYLPDGNIDFIGRIDNQVKIRGYRIELGEIETVLSQHPAIRECVVDTLENLRGDSSASSRDAKTLVAYVVVHNRGAVTTEELRNSLKRTLPEYMIPGTFVYLDSLPLTPNGKVDRESLPAPDQSRPELENAFIAPRTPMEKFLAQIWLEVLNVSEIGVHDNFFELGGHSLLATQVISRMRKAFGVEIPLRALFESPTIEQMAAAIAHNPVSAASQTQLARILTEVEKMTDAESQKLLSTESRQV